jgi:hypothetical protein
VEESAETGLAFLAAHQPMPPDEALDEELIRRFDLVRRHFVERPDPRCLPLFLRALPNGSSGFGVYQLLDDVLQAHDAGVVVAELVEALATDVPSHAWVLELALGYDDPQLRSLARRFIQSADDDERLCAQTYLTAHDA